ncbi:hypothetical protein BC834DRAFT_877705 [Gloeopeniophorella convolvens]|nr:hypothetical protein BC834DRAFT_877705 [Gloeopeniophorella convolvens]
MSGIGGRVSPSGGVVNDASATIESLPDDVLLDIFDSYRLDMIADTHSFGLYQWYQVVPAHVCQRWRRIIIASPKRLRLQICCSWDFPAAEVLRYSPPFPIVVRYTATGRADYGMVVAVGHLDRIRDLTLRFTPLYAHMVHSMSNRRAPLLENLDLTLDSHKEYMSLPGPFILGDDAPQLRQVRLANVLFPVITARNVVSFTFILHLSNPGGTWLDDLSASIHSMPRLQLLSLRLEQRVSSISPFKDRPRVVLQELRTIRYLGPSIPFDVIFSRIEIISLIVLNLNITDPQPVIIPSLARYFYKLPRSIFTLAHVEASPTSLYVASSPTYPPPGQASVLLRLYHSGPELSPLIPDIAQALQPAFADVKTVIVGSNDETFLFGTGDVAGAPLWRIFLPSLSTAAHLLIDDINVPSAVQVLIQPGISDLLPNLHDISLLYRAEGNEDFTQLHAEEAVSSIHDVHQTVDVSYKMFLPGEWSTRHAHLSCP